MLKKMLFVSLFITVLSSSIFAEAPAKDELRVEQFITQFMESYEHRDLRSILNCYAPNAVVIGTGKDEVLVGIKSIQEGFQHDLNQQSAAKVTVHKISVSVIKPYAVVAYNVDVNVDVNNSDKSFISRLRFTATLKQEGNRWLILQSHLSSPLATQAAGEAFPRV